MVLGAILARAETGQEMTMPRAPLPMSIFDGVIDVSHHNGAIDWPAVAAAGIALVFIKATQGNGFVDPRFEHNRRGAMEAGLLVVPYHFLDLADAEEQAAHFLDVTGLGTGEPAMIDWETAAPASSLVAFGRVLRAVSGRVPVAYYGFAQLRHADRELSGWPLLLPEYPRGNAPGCYRSLVRRSPRLPPGRAACWEGGQRPYDFHQYTPAGHVDGIATVVDRSVWVGDLAALKTWHAPTPG
jgi:lysozyme